MAMAQIINDFACGLLLATLGVHLCIEEVGVDKSMVSDDHVDVTVSELSHIRHVDHRSSTMVNRPALTRW